MCVCGGGWGVGGWMSEEGVRREKVECVCVGGGGE